MKGAPDYFQCSGSECFGSSWAPVLMFPHLSTGVTGGDTAKWTWDPPGPASICLYLPPLSWAAFTLSPGPVCVLSNRILARKQVNSQERQKGDPKAKTSDHRWLAAPDPLLERQNQQPQVSSNRMCPRMSQAP